MMVVCVELDILRRMVLNTFLVFFLADYVSLLVYTLFMRGLMFSKLIRIVSAPSELGRVK